jgi:hypothetical protein
LIKGDDDLPRWTVQTLKNTGIGEEEFNYMTIVFNIVHKSWFSEIEISIGRPPTNKQFIYDEKLYGTAFLEKLKTNKDISQNINTTRRRIKYKREGGKHNTTAKL